MTSKPSLRERVRALLAALEPRTLRSGFSSEAAVLIPIFERAGEPYFLLTRRTEEVPTHKGQIAFPGGRRHEGEELETTALRERNSGMAVRTPLATMMSTVGSAKRA